jgi:ADP-ribose pyrophosphatase YjhB (NUDIX family)
MQSEEKIRIKAMCLFHKNGKVLVSRGFDKVKNEHFYRLLGGSVNFFETSESGVRREIQEELQSEIENLKLVHVIENLFTYEGRRRHQIVFLYSGDLARKELYEQNSIHIVEDTCEFDAQWVPTSDILSGRIPLYPAFDYKILFQE